jgi:hypothetical protein
VGKTSSSVFEYEVPEIQVVGVQPNVVGHAKFGIAHAVGLEQARIQRRSHRQKFAGFGILRTRHTRRTQNQLAKLVGEHLVAVEVVHEFGAVACEELSVSEFAATCRE